MLTGRNMQQQLHSHGTPHGAHRTLSQEPHHALAFAYIHSTRLLASRCPPLVYQIYILAASLPPSLGWIAGSLKSIILCSISLLGQHVDP